MGTPARRRLLLVGWSNTGGTQRLLEAAADGAREAVADAPESLDVLACRCDRVSDQALLRADALLFATPECLGSMAGPMKAFFDRCYYPALDRINGRPYAALVCAGSDGQNAARQIERIATGWRLRAMAEALIVCTRAQTPEQILAPKTSGAEDLDRCRELGATLASGLAMGVF